METEYEQDTLKEYYEQEYVSITLKEYYELKAEIGRLKRHIRDLDSDLNSMVEQEDDLTPAQRLGEK